MRNTMLLIFSVACMMSRSRDRPISRRNNASNSAPMPPTPAASVGVASPPSIEPSTAKMSNSGGSSARRICSSVTASSSPRSKAGISAGLKKAVPSR